MTTPEQQDPWQPGHPPLSGEQPFSAHHPPGEPPQDRSARQATSGYPYPPPQHDASYQYAQHPPQPYPYHPYGQYPNQPYGQYPQYAHPQYQYQQPYPYQYAPPQRPSFRERFLPDAEPGRFSWWDLAAVLVYLIGFSLGIIPLIVMFTPLGTMAESADAGEQAVAGFLINGVSYVIVGTVVVLACWRPLLRSVRAFAPLWWAKLLIVPVIWLVGIICSALTVAVLSVFGLEPEVSQNQQDIEIMLQEVPFLAAAVLMVVLAPLVEEYLFRHLLIGRLSRFINRWLLGAVSVVLFALMHVTVELIDPEATFSLAAVVPYIMMGVVFVLVYILSGRSLLYAWLVHAFFNFMALAMQYFLLPQLEEAVPELEQAPGVLLSVAEAALKSVLLLLG